MQADLMKLIAYGKVMEDDTKTLEGYSIKEGDFLVVMISKVSLIQIHSTCRISKIIISLWCIRELMSLNLG